MPATLPPDAVLFHDACLLIINKPAGLATTAGRGETDSAMEQAARLCGPPITGEPRLRLVHRLDSDTSGVLVLAKTADAQQHLSHQFQNNSIERDYLGLVVGAPLEDQGVIDAPIGEHPTSPHRMLITKHGRPAITHWAVESRFRQYTLLRVRPKTGKLHQVRLHLRHIGLPLAIDPIYSSADTPAVILLSSFKRGYRPKPDQDERPLIARLTLHAQRMKLVHPDGRTLDIDAPLPKDMRTVLQSLAKFGMR